MPAEGEPFPLSRWFTPEVQGFGRVPIVAARPPRMELAEARADGPSPWVIALDEA